jgi:hypothetical protein
MTDYSKKNVLFIGSGIDCTHAERMAQDVQNLWYFTPVFNGFPKIEDYANGFGLPGVEKIMRPHKYINKADLIVFGDIGNGDWADKLREEGHTVFGSGEKEEDLELDRFKARQIQDKLGLPIQYTEKKKGMTALTKYLEKNKDVYVKPFIFRGTRETTHVTNDRIMKELLKKLAARFGPMGEEVTFTCEDPVKDAIAEVAYGIVFNGKEAIKPYEFGLEKDGPYILHYRDELPAPIQNSLNRISKLLAKTDYRGAFSDEELVVSNKKSYPIDFTVRWAFPLSTIYCETWKNYTEVIFKCAQGEDVKIDVIAPFAGCLSLACEEAEKDWVWVDINKENERHVRPIYGCCTKDGYYAVKGYSVGINLIAWGGSVESVVSQLKDLAGSIDSHDLRVEYSRLDDIVSDIEKLNEIGIEF